jgi:hypothetical protein
MSSIVQALAKRTRNNRVRVDNLGHVRQLASIDYLLNERELAAIRQAKLLGANEKDECVPVLSTDEQSRSRGALIASGRIAACYQT